MNNYMNNHINNLSQQNAMMVETGSSDFYKSGQFTNNEEKYAFTRSEIYKTKDEAKAVADQETEKRKLEAEKNLHHDNL